MSEVSRTDTQLVQDIRHALETEQFDSDAVRKVRQILAPVVPAGGLPDFDFEAASEAERWAFDQGHQQGYDEAVTDAVENPEAFTQRLQELRHDQ